MHESRVAIKAALGDPVTGCRPPGSQLETAMGGREGKVLMAIAHVVVPGETPAPSLPTYDENAHKKLLPPMRREAPLGPHP